MQKLTAESFSERLLRVASDIKFRQRIKFYYALGLIAALTLPFLIGHWAINITFPIWMMWLGTSEAVLSHCSGMVVSRRSIRHATYSGTFGYRYRVSLYYVAIALGVVCFVKALATGSAALFQGQ